MKKFLTALLLGSLIFVSPAVVSASSETTYESEEGQAMIKPPSSSEQSSETEDETTDETDAQEEEGTIRASGILGGYERTGTNGSWIFPDEKQSYDRNQRKFFQSSRI